MFLRHFGLMVLFLVWVPTGVSAQEIRSCGGDPSIGTSCSVGLGECTASGTIRCLGSTLDCSATPGIPATEIYNGLDDDCDGVIDEGCYAYEPLLLFSLVFLVGSGCYYYWLRRRAVRKEEK